MELLGEKHNGRISRPKFKMSPHNRHTIATLFRWGLLIRSMGRIYSDVTRDDTRNNKHTMAPKAAEKAPAKKAAPPSKCRRGVDSHSEDEPHAAGTPLPPRCSMRRVSWGGHSGSISPLCSALTSSSTHRTIQSLDSPLD